MVSRSGQTDQPEDEKMCGSAKAAMSCRRGEVKGMHGRGSGTRSSKVQQVLHLAQWRHGDMAIYQQLGAEAWAGERRHWREFAVLKTIGNKDLCTVP